MRVLVCVGVPVLLCVCVRVFPRDLIKVLKWYVDRIVDAEHQDHIQQVLKVSVCIHTYPPHTH